MTDCQFRVVISPNIIDGYTIRIGGLNVVGISFCSCHAHEQGEQEKNSLSSHNDVVLSWLQRYEEKLKCARFKGDIFKWATTQGK
jgi:hypothetical protein